MKHFDEAPFDLESSALRRPALGLYDDERQPHRATIRDGLGASGRTDVSNCGMGHQAVAHVAASDSTFRGSRRRQVYSGRDHVPDRIPERQLGDHVTDASAFSSETLTPKGRATRDRILTSAAEVILADGLTGLSMDKVRLRAGVSGSQLTHYFHDRPSLVRAVLARQFELVMAIHREPNVGNLDTWTDWENWIEVNLAQLRMFGYSGRPTYHGLAGQLVKSDPDTREAVAGGYLRWIEFFEDRLSRMKSHGALAALADPQRLAMVVVGGHHGGCLISFAYRQAWPLAHAMRFIVNYLRSFAADPQERSARRGNWPVSRRPSSAAHESQERQPRLTRKGRATRDRIVEIAAELMFRNGVRNTSVDDVRRAAGVSGSQLSHYFSDKADLTRQVIAARGARVEIALQDPTLAGLSSVAALRRWAATCEADIEPVHLRGGCPYGSLVAELTESAGVVNQLADGYERWLLRLRQGLTAMKASGELSERADADHLSLGLLAAHQGGTMLTHAIGLPEPCSTLLNGAVDYIASFTVPPRIGPDPRT
jgi:AcrR family transcriptional regulator